jgi:Peptidase inhibitor family I36
MRIRVDILGGLRLKTRNLVKVILAAVLPAIGLAVLAAQPASAAYSCADNQVCFYEGAYYSGTAFVPREMSGNSGSVPDFRYRVFTNGTNANDRVTSIVNNTGWCVVVYRGIWFVDDSGAHSGWQIFPDSRVNLAGTEFDNRVSSAKFQWKTLGCP